MNGLLVAPNTPVGHGKCPYPIGMADISSAIKAEVRHWKSIVGDSFSIGVSDDLLADSKMRLKSFGQVAKEAGLGGWNIQMRVTQINPETIDILQETGCNMVCLGLESASDKILKSMRKKISFEQSVKALALLHAAGISSTGNFIFGDAEETWETAMETLDWRESHPQYAIKLLPILIFPSSHLYGQAVASGRLDPKDRLVRGVPLVNVSKMSDEEYGRLVDQIHEKMLARESGEARGAFKINKPELELNVDSSLVTVKGGCPHCGGRIESTCHLNVINVVLGMCPKCAGQLIPPRLESEPKWLGRIQEGLQAVLPRHKLEHRPNLQKPDTSPTDRRTVRLSD